MFLRYLGSSMFLHAHGLGSTQKQSWTARDNEQVQLGDSSRGIFCFPQASESLIQCRQKLSVCHTRFASRGQESRENRKFV